MQEKKRVYPPGVIKTRRRAIGWNLVGTANMLDNLHGTNLGSALEKDDDFLDDAEKAMIKKLASAMATCEAKLRELSVRLGVEE